MNGDGRVRRSSPRSLNGERRRRVGVHLSEQEHAIVSTLAKANGVSISRYMVDSALYSTDRVSPAQLIQLRQTLRQAQAELNKIGSNINQIARAANTNHEQPAATVAAMNSLRALSQTMIEALLEVRKS